MSDHRRNLTVRDGDRVVPVTRPEPPPEPEPTAWCGTPAVVRMAARPAACKGGHLRHPNPRMQDVVCPRCGRPPEGDYE